MAIPDGAELDWYGPLDDVNGDGLADESQTRPDSCCG